MRASVAETVRASFDEVHPERSRRAQDERSGLHVFRYKNAKTSLCHGTDIPIPAHPEPFDCAQGELRRRTRALEYPGIRSGAAIGIAALLFALLCPSAFAQADAGAARPQPQGFESHVTPEQVRLGDPFIYELVFTHAPSQRIELRTPTDLGPFELLSVERSRRDAGQSVTTFKLKMSLFELDKHRLPDLTFEVFDEKGSGEFVAPGRDVEAVSTLPQNAQQKGEALFDIRPPEDVPVRSYRLLWALAAVLAAAAIGYGVYRFIRRPRPVVDKPRVVLPLDQRTTQALDALAAEDLPGKGRGREFHFRLSEIVRGYLGERYQFDALECTTSELLEALRRRQTPGLPEAELRQFADQSDMVKFAKVEATPLECKQALQFAYELVKNTHPLPAPPATAHASGPQLS